jgi:U3 small nucleolar RNA-associated protein 25
MYVSQKELMPKIQKSPAGRDRGTLVFVPSYFDYVRLRNWWRSQITEVENMRFVVLSEYAETGDITRNRAGFRDGDMDYALFTERFHYYHRYHIKGIKHIIFYQLPTIAGLYAELLNMMPTLGGTATILISRYDVLALQRVVGDSRGTKMLRAEKDTHLLC